MFANGSGKRLVKILRSHSERFRHLELVRWNFDGCAWTWLSRCPNLIEFAITNEPPEKVRGVLGNNYKTYRLKVSKNSKITTAHWHLGVDDGTFYFHPDESSLEPYGEKPRIVVQSDDLYEEDISDEEVDDDLYYKEDMSDYLYDDNDEEENIFDADEEDISGDLYGDDDDDEGDEKRRRKRRRKRISQTI